MVGHAWLSDFARAGCGKFDIALPILVALKLNISDINIHGAAAGGGDWELRPWSASSILAGSIFLTPTVENRTMTTSQPNILTGRDAIEYADTHGLTVNKYADPTEGAREGLDPSEAAEIANEDPGLIWLTLPTLDVCGHDDTFAGQHSEFVAWLRAQGIDARVTSGPDHNVPVGLWDQFCNQ